MIEDYLASNNFASKAERTKDDYRYYLGQIKDKFGDAPIRDLEPPQGRVFIYRFINRFSAKPRKGNHFRALFSVICSHALLINKLKSNPVDGLCSPPGRGSSSGPSNRKRFFSPSATTR